MTDYESASNEFSEHLCYILYNTTNQATYVGYTNKFDRRIRQHNGLLAHGAKATSRQTVKGVVWLPLALVRCKTPGFDHRRALSLEWSLRYPDNKRPMSKCFNGWAGRLRGLALALNNPKFADLEFEVEVFREDEATILQQALGNRARVVASSWPKENTDLSSQ